MLNKAQLMEVPGGPGVVGAIQAGTGILIDTSTGVTSVDPTKVVTKILAGSGVAINPPTGVGVVTVSSTATSDIPAGSTTVFAQAAAPTGWVKSTALDNVAIRVVSGSGGGTGGSNAFTTSFSNYTPTGTINSGGFSVSGGVQPASLSVSQIASHSHNYESRECSPQGAVPATGMFARCTSTSGAAGGNGGHTHSWSGSVQGSASFSGTTTSQFAVRYVDVIICTKS